MRFEIDHFSAAEVIIKISERCNINCSYCYMFNKGNNDYLARPASIDTKTLNATLSFLKNGFRELSTKHVTIVLHGGEPLMLGKRKFSELCELLIFELSPELDFIGIGIQTNGILIDDDWIKIFSKYSISVGVSLDGTKEVNDRYRIDKNGSGTYEATIKGVERLRSAYNDGLINRPGAICVIDPASNAKEVYHHLVNVLGFQQVSFNLPMETVDTAEDNFGQLCGVYLTDLFSAWTEGQNPDIEIRMFDQLLRYLAGDKQLIDTLPNIKTKHLMVVIASDGELSDHDDFKVINFAQRGGNVFDTTLKEFANSELREYLHHLSHAFPDDCRSCDWKNYCRAGITHGLTVSRYSEKNGFNNKSTLCNGFLQLFEVAAVYLNKNGLSEDSMRASLGIGISPTDSEIKVRKIPESLLPNSI